MDATEKSFDLVKETSRLLITLATGFIAFTVTLAKAANQTNTINALESWIWSACWITMLVSIGCGIWTHLGMATVLAPNPPSKQDSSTADPTIRAPSIKLPFAFQIILFGLATVLMVVFGITQVSA